MLATGFVSTGSGCRIGLTFAIFIHDQEGDDAGRDTQDGAFDEVRVIEEAFRSIRRRKLNTQDVLVPDNRPWVNHPAT